jgi:plastocyanin
MRAFETRVPRIVRAALLACAVAASGCGGGGGDGPSGLPTPASVTITTQLTELFVGQSLQLIAQALDDAGVEIAAGDASWTSNSTSVVQVSETGMLLAMAPGTATLTVTIAGKSASLQVTVEALPPYDITIQVGSTFAPASFTVRRGGTVRFTFSGTSQNVTFSRAFAGAPTDIPATTTGTVNRQFGTIGDYRFESTVTPGMAGFVRVR